MNVRARLSSIASAVRGRLGAWSGLLWAMAAGLAGEGSPGSVATASADQPSFRVAMSAGTFGEVNRNDARAAVLAWSRTILSARDIAVSAEALIIDSAPDVFSALRRREVDAATVLTSDLMSQPQAEAPDSVFLAVKNNRWNEQYVLVVRQSDAISELKDLRGRTLELHSGPRCSLAPLWLDNVLAGEQLGLANEVFTRINRNVSASKVVLRVFFGQATAGVVTRAVLDTMGELNPQVRKELRVLATSPDLVPSLFFFRHDFAPETRAKMETAILGLHESPAGKQILTVFQGERMEKHPPSCLDSARALYAERARLLANRSDPPSRP